jgi:hypothetical protein
MELLGIISVDFDVADQLLITYSAFVSYWKKGEYSGAVHKTCASFGIELLCNNLIGLCIPMVLVNQLKCEELCLLGYMTVNQCF